MLIISRKYRCFGNGCSNEESTLAMIKPDGLFGNHTSMIKNSILESGFSICRETMVQLDEDNAKSFYAEHSSKSFFPSLVKYMTRYLCSVMIRRCYCFSFTWSSPLKFFLNFVILSWMSCHDCLTIYIFFYKNPNKLNVLLLLN